MNEGQGKSGRSKTVVKLLTWLARLVVGSVFIFSGFVKAVDPWGTLYKFGEYFAAMGIPPLHSPLVAGVFGLCALEFLIGVFLLLGCYRRSAPLIALAFMCVMLPLTLWIALKNPVADCGCFGDYLVISNWATFWKNVILTAFIVWLVKFNRCCITIISPAFQWIGAVISFCFITAVSTVGYLQQPLLDFRPYSVGTPLVVDDDEEDEDNFVFIYQKGGEKKEFRVNDELPTEEDGWTFVERGEKKSSGEVRKDEGKTFRIWNRVGDEDVTDQLLRAEDNCVILLIPDMEDVSPATTWEINALHDWASRQKISMFAVVSGTTRQIAEWEDMSMPDYEIFTADDTAIKEVARGNPAVVMVSDGIIAWKSTLRGLKTLEQDKGLEFKPSNLIIESKSKMFELFWIYIIFMTLPLILTFMPRIRNAFGIMVSRKRKDHS